MHLLGTALLLLSLLGQTRPNELLALVMFIRHGARAPNYVSFPFAEMGVTYPFQLTPLGRQQHRELGGKVRQLFPDRDFGDATFFSSPKSRCIDSMAFFMAGFGQRGVESAHVLPKSFMNPSKKLIGSEARRDLVNSMLSSQIAEVHSLAVTDGFEPTRDFYCPFCKAGADHFDRLTSLKRLDSVLTCFLGHQSLPLPFSDSLVPHLEKSFRILYYKVIFRTKKDAAAYCLASIKALGKGLITAAQQKNRIFSLDPALLAFYTSDLKVSTNMFFFAHDANLICFLRLFLSSDQLVAEARFRPPFAADLTIELLREPGGEMPLVRVRYLGEHLPTRLCPGDCPLDTFLSELSKML